MAEQIARVARAPWWQPVQTFHASGRPNPRALPEPAWERFVHGTLVGYKTYHCRCHECRQANTDHVRAVRRDRIRAWQAERRRAAHQAHRPHEYAQRAEVKRTLKFFRLREQAS